VSTLEAADGAAAIELFTRCADEIAAVLLDLTMPRMGGAEVFLALRRLRPDLPVLLTSGSSELLQSEQLPQGPRVDFIQKPYRPHELLEKLHALLAERDA
jgi:two-component system cell cycle sensor histidine kinase/response regulator CckA